ncbi:MAG: damage-inducible protein [Rhodoferax sp.]|nr:damage-inducible protein [Rhodoferax sp.]
MPTPPDLAAVPSLASLAERIGPLLRIRGDTVAVAESSTGGLVSAALLSLPGASAFFVGGAVVYTLQARKALLGLSEADLSGIRPSTEAYAGLIAERVRLNHGTVWGLGESGAAGPTGNRYGDAAGHVCLAVAGPAMASRTVETGDADRKDNMEVFARHLLALFESVLRNDAPA